MRTFVLDTGALEALARGNSVLARLLYGTPRDVDDVVTALNRGPRLLVPALSLLQAGRERHHLAQHIAELEALQVVALDAAAVIALCGPLVDLAGDIGHAVHVAVRHDATLITPTPKAYPDSVRTVLLRS